ncbi:glycosyltransferase family 2 protein [Kaistella pullorum]|uniref:Glycosyltransferase family 2 protein n=1 Tax=Kaistella pullorum TaxID=2763074 RepID=A0ABR8WJR6_9FLAO|nr:glycosyltransferase family 2 protein [Kaistella pullorum]MBD8016991.1 glycosyltransferase family 2 protein [Kaistella pullorum]
MEFAYKISIIIPCYNAEPYIEQCLDSILCQTYIALEIICIDDGSTDSTLQILKENAEKDSRLQLITQKNAGIAAARNAGLKIASGNYIAFVDADDWLETDTFEKVLGDNGGDVIFFSYYRNFGSTQLTKDLGLSGNFPALYVQRRIVGLVGPELKDITSFDALMTCWGKLYKRELLTDLRFRDLKDFGTWEDGIFNLEVLENASTVRIINKPYYHYRKAPQATYTTSYKPDLYQRWLYKFEWIREFIEQHHKSAEYYTALQNRIAVTTLNLAFNEMNSRKSFTEKTQVISQILKHPLYISAFGNFQFKHVPMVWKIFYYFAAQRNAVAVTLMADLIYKWANRKSTT